MDSFVFVHTLQSYPATSFLYRSEIISHDYLFEWFDGFFQNFGTEMVGAILTFILIEVLVGAREKEEAEQAEEDRKREIQEFMDRVSQRTEDQVAAFLDNQQAIITAHVDQALKDYQEQLDEQEKQALINQLSSTVPGLPAEAVRLLRHKGWLENKDIAVGLRSGGDFQLADLREAVLEQQQLNTAKLSQANLEYTNLTGTNLASANLKGANLREANFKDANLRGANFKEVRITQTDFEGADLSFSNLEGVVFQEVNLKRTDLVNANLEGADLREANLEGADLRATNLKGVALSQVNLREVDLCEAKLNGANLWKANLKDALLVSADLEEASLSRANLNGAHLQGARLKGANLSYANLEGARLRNAKLEEVVLEGAILPDGTKLPGRTWEERHGPEPDWRTPFEEWDKAGRPRIEPPVDEPENDEES